jgi:hypothetical protein
MADRCIVRSLLGAKSVCAPDVTEPQGISCCARKVYTSCEVKSVLDHSLGRKFLPVSYDRNFYFHLVTENLLTPLLTYLHSKRDSVLREQMSSNF